MHEALYLLNEMNDGDLNWIFETGTEQQVIANTVVVREGEHPDSLYFVLSGLVGIHIAAVGEERLATLGPGELIGEVSFLEDRPASATVSAVENTLLLTLPRQQLESKIEEDPAFASRLHRSFAIVLSRRLRERVGDLGHRLQARPATEEATSEAWQRISVAIDAFKQLMQRVDQNAIQNDGVVAPELVEEVSTGISQFSTLMNAEIGTDSSSDAHVRDVLGARIQREFLPYLLLTRTAERFYSKPRGYAGDFLTIEWIYRNQPQGTGRIGPVVDQVFLEYPTCRAVRNRRRLLADKIRRAVQEKQGEPARVTSLACGPGRELFDAFAELDDTNLLEATLIDIDMQALAFVSDQRAKHKLDRRIHLVPGNLVYLATGKQQLELKNQDLVYSIGLIDYFNDKFVVALLDYVHGLLGPRGKVILGNFHVRNTCRAFMDYVLDWRLIHRTEDDMNRLFAASRFGKPCTEIEFEESRINLFAACTKE